MCGENTKKPATSDSSLDQIMLYMKRKMVGGLILIPLTYLCYRDENKKVRNCTLKSVILRLQKNLNYYITQIKREITEIAR